MNWNLLRPVLMEGEPGAGGAGADPGTPPADSGTPPADSGVPFYSSLPEDWRAQALGAAGFEKDSEDFAKRLGQLDRVPDIGTLTKNYLEAQDRIRKGEMSTGLPENPTDEQLAEWRQAHGVPESADAYELQLDEGLVLGEDDTRIMNDVFKAAHGHHIPAAAMSEMTNAFLKSREAEVQALVNQDGIDEQTATRQIKESWGGDYQTNINMIDNLVGQLPESIREAFSGARMADGRLMFNSPEVMVAMADWARKLNPAATVVPNANNPVQTINDEIKALEAKMGTDEWYKDKDAQQRYQELLDAQKAMG